MTTTDRRDGPTLRVVGSCEGCRWLRADESISAFRQIASYVYHCGEPTMLKVHPLGARPRKIGRRPETPAWCPRLAEARAALGREMVGEAVLADIVGPAVGSAGARCSPIPGSRFVRCGPRKVYFYPVVEGEDEAPIVTTGADRADSAAHGAGEDEETT